jgi:hypothetical protein
LKVFLAFRMNTPSDPFKMVVVVRDHDHFESMNDYICYQRSKIKTYEWFHRGHCETDCSVLTVEFYHKVDALIFKLTFG